jgi:hypothetical protein
MFDDAIVFRPPPAARGAAATTVGAIMRLHRGT